MLRPRLIPVLLIRNKGLVKTIQFADGKYVGDPLNAVRIFNEKEVDELIVLDIDATSKGQEPSYKLIALLAAECRMPLCYGGGVKNLEQVRKIVTLGVEKVAISSAAIDDPSFLSTCAESVGIQSIVAVVDVKRSRWRKRYEVYTHNGTRKTGKSLDELIPRLVAAGAGEIVINSIDNDGEMQGYDLELAKIARNLIDVPVTFVGGAGSLEDVGALFERVGIVGAAAGSLYVFKGRYRAVLINYPNRTEKEAVIHRSMVNEYGPQYG